MGRHVVSVGSHQHCAVGFVRFSYFNFYGFCFVIELMWIFLFTVLNHVLVWMHDDLNEFFIWVFLIPTEIIVFVSLCSSLSSHNQLVKADFLEQIFSSPLSSIDEDK